MGKKIVYNDFKTLIVMLMIAGDQMIDIRAITAYAFTSTLNSFQMKDFSKIRLILSNKILYCNELNLWKFI